VFADEPRVDELRHHNVHAPRQHQAVRLDRMRAGRSDGEGIGVGVEHRDLVGESGVRWVRYGTARDVAQERVHFATPHVASARPRRHKAQDRRPAPNIEHQRPGRGLAAPACYVAQGTAERGVVAGVARAIIEHAEVPALGGEAA